MVFRRISCLFLAIVCWIFFSFAKADTPPAPPKVDATAYILMDARSGTILAADHADDRLPPASLTKLMTLYLTFNALKNGSIHLTDNVRISQKAWKTGGSRMFLRVGTNVTVAELIQGIIVQSGNDACVALAEYLAGSESAFVELMNTTAKKLGMNNTHFIDSTGLGDPVPNKSTKTKAATPAQELSHYSSAHDLAILSRAIILNFPEDYHYFSEKWFTYNNIKQPNRNRLLWHYQYADGLKTGHTSQAGYCLVGSAEKNNMRLITVVLGAPSDTIRLEDSEALLTYGFRFFVTTQVVAAGDTLKTPRIYLGEEKTLAVGLEDSVYVTVPEGMTAQITKKIQLDSPLLAPMKKGQTVGLFTVSLSDKPMMQAPIIALTDAPEGGFWRRFVDHIVLGFHHFVPTKQEE